MAPTSPRPHVRPGRFWLIPVSLLVMLSVAAVVKVRGTAEGRFRQRLAALEDRGLLVPWQPSAYADELQQDLREAFSSVAEHFEGGSRTPTFITAVKSGNETREDYEKARAWLPGVRSYIDEMESILARPPIRAALEHRDRLSLETPRLREAWRRLDPVLAAARFEAEDGDQERSVELLQLALDLKQCYNDQTIFGDLLSSMSGDIQGVILWVLEHTEADPMVYAEAIGPRLAGAWDTEYRALLLKNQIARMRDEASRLARRRRTGRSVQEILGEEGGDWDSHFSLMDEALDGLVAQFPIAELSAPAFHRQYEQTLSRVLTAEVSQVELQALGIYKWAHFVIASNALFRVQLALMAHERLHGEFPERLDGLTNSAELPVDPHTARAFLYKRIEGTAHLGPALFGPVSEPVILESR